ncbi:restriction endonuclease subunit S [Enterococcus faecalis]|uniref:restriction endonuclease subunit S n=1 Tax=Enterococcus faecalis TaxID=1351 RepID=UPI0021C9502C|nr:restriction endonuclease subunit S [Enterococcus faecalis]MCU2258194.1 restriction endonuclease subunit S [Enterococcus faecalis]
MNYKIGDIIEQIKIKNGNPNHPNISGINILKQFMPSTNVGADTSKYLVVPHNSFACNLMHVGRDERIPIAMNAKGDEIVVSSAYFVFQITKTETVLPEYLNMIFQSSEFDRYAWFCTDASIRGNLDWTRFCDIDIDLPPFEIQEKYVAVYKSLLANQQSYENGLEDLKLVCDATIEKLRHKMPSEAIGAYIKQVDERNDRLDDTFVRGISTSKEIIATKAKMDGISVSNYKKLKPRHIAYVPDTSRRGDKISIAMNDQEETVLVSLISTIFQTNESRILPEFLMLFFSKSDFDRYARFHSWGSARETFNWEDMQEVKIPIPDINIQKSIVDIYNAYIARREINEQLKAQIKEICPILINGAIKEAKVYAEV